MAGGWGERVMAWVSSLGPIANSPYAYSLLLAVRREKDLKTVCGQDLKKSWRLGGVLGRLGV